MALGKMAREHLEQELLLNKGGGIYYENARVEASDTEATLFIGLGGTGADMLIRIKNEVKRRMVLPTINGKLVSDTPSNIAFLALDTDKNTTKKTWGTATFDQFGEEFCSLAIGDIPAIVTQWKTKSEAGVEEAKWYDKVDGVAALPGAGGIRQIGRLMLFENVRTVNRRIQEKIRKITEDGINSVTVVLVTGIAGGTGSGTFLDVAYLARHALENLNIGSKKVYGYVVLPDVNLKKGGNEVDLWRNGFASLKELDYWMSPGENEHKAQFVQNYGSEVSVRSIASPPFEFCHLLSAQALDGSPLSYDKVISSMAENVFAYIAGEVGYESSGSGGSMDAMYSNISGYITTLTTLAPMPACYRYLAVGSHKLEIPYEEISTLLAVRLFEKLEPTLALRPTEDTFKADMRDLRLIPREVIHDSLQHDVPPSPLDYNPGYQYAQIWKDENNGPKSNRPYADIHSWFAYNYQTTVTKNQANWVQVQKGMFLNFVKDNIKKPDRGPTYIAALLKSDSEWSIIPTLTKMAEHCRDCANTALSMRNEMDARLAHAYNAGHGKLINRNKYVADFLVALNDWKENEKHIHVHPIREELIRQLRDDLQKMYDKVFTRLDDLFEALPVIFKQNLEYMAIAQREAETEMRLEKDTRLIWPLIFEKENKAEFDKLLQVGIVDFLDRLSANLHRWTGCDLENLDDSTGTDVPGFISRFISEQFGGLFEKIKMEDIMRSKEGADDLDPYLRKCLGNLRDGSVPMFSMRQTYKNTSTAEFGICSVPENCLEILSSAKKYVPERVEVKQSKEKTRLYFVKVVSGIPLYAYSKIEDAEKVYEQAKQSANGQGMHLHKDWRDDFPTPLPESAWSPTVYENPAVKAYNDSVREAFRICRDNNILKPDREDGPTKLMLFIADPSKADVSQLDLSELPTLKEQIDVLNDERDSLWSKESIDLLRMSTFGGDDLYANVLENVLRIPRLASEVKRQAEIVSSFDSFKKELEDPSYYAYALISGLVAKQGFKVVLKRGIDSVSSELLYDDTSDNPFGEYEAYTVFRSKLDDDRRDSINTIRREMFERISEGSSEAEEVLARTESVAKRYLDILPELKRRIDRAAVDKRKSLKDTYRFYLSVQKIAETDVQRIKSVG